MIGNYDICAEWKISFTYETKQNKIRFRLRGWDQKIFSALPPNFVKGHKESCLKFCRFCMAWIKVSKIQQYWTKLQVSLAKFSKNILVLYSIKQKVTKIYEVLQNVMKFQKILWNFTKVNEISQNVMKFHVSKQC